MTEDKRFELADIGFVYDNGKLIGMKEIVDRLNEVHEINGRCNREITLNHQKILKLMNENEQLKQTVSDWSGSYDELFEDVKRLEEENGQLKSENELLKQDLEHCANQFKDDGKNVLLGLK